jgi:MarR family transcriptional regulator, temperature-dependent positive regulator of motility
LAKLISILSNLTLWLCHATRLLIVYQLKDRMSQAQKQQSLISTSSQEELDLYQLPGHLIRRMHQMGVALFDSYTKESGYDLTPVQFAALRVVAAYPGLDQASLANEVAYDRVTTGGVVDRLEQKGFLRRDVNKADRRARMLNLTIKGETLLREITPIIKQIEADLLIGLTSSEGETLLRLLNKNLRALTENNRSPLKTVQ